MKNERAKYSAFLSYRHTPADRQVARWLHRSLESFRTPSALVNRGIPSRIQRVFRDEEELRAASDLTQELKDALERSEHLIVLCSRTTNQSPWVEREIAHFRSLGRSDRILVVLLEGEPREVLPASLRGNDGQEPLAADLRVPPGESARTVRRHALLRVLAALLGCEFEALRQREAERRMRRMLLTAGLLAAGTVGTGTLAWYADGQRRRAETNEQLAKDNEKSAKDNAKLANDNERIAKENERRAIESDRVSRERLADILEERAFRQYTDGEHLAALDNLRAAQESRPEGSASAKVPLAGLVLARLQGFVQCADLHDVPLVTIATNPRGDRILTADEDGTFVCADPVAKKVVWACRYAGVFSGPAHIHMFADGERFLFGDRSGIVRCCRLADGSQVWANRHGYGDIVQFAVDAKESLVVTTSTAHLRAESTTFKIWSCADGRLMSELAHGSEGIAAAFSPDSNLVATVANDNRAVLWQVADQKEVAAFSLTKTPTACAFLPDDRLLVWSDERVECWRRDAAKPTFALKGRSNARLLSPDQTHIAVRDSFEVTLYATADGAKTASLRTACDEAFWLGDNRGLLVTSGSRAWVWDPTHNGLIADLQGHTSMIRDALVTSGGTRLFTAGADERWIEWNLDATKGPMVVEHRNYALRSIRLIQQERLLVHTFDQRLRLHDRHSGRELHEFDLAAGKEHRFSVPIDWAQAADRIVSCNGDPAVGVVSLADGTQRSIVVGSVGIEAVALAPDGRTAFAGDASGRIVALDLDGGPAAVPREVTRCKGTPTLLRMAGHGGVLAVATREELVLVNPNDGKHLQTHAIARSPDELVLDPTGNHGLVLVRDHPALLLDLEPTHPSIAIGPNLPIHTAALFPGGDRALLAWDKAVLWNCRKGAAESTWRNQTHLAFDAVATSPDGRLVALGSSHRIHLLDGHSFEHITTFSSLCGDVNDVAFVASGEELVVAGSGIAIHRIRSADDGKWRSMDWSGGWSIPEVKTIAPPNVPVARRDAVAIPVPTPDSGPAEKLAWAIATNDHAGTIENADILLAQSPEDWETLYRRCVALAERGEHAKALADSERLLVSPPFAGWDRERQKMVHFARIVASDHTGALEAGMESALAVHSLLGWKASRGAANRFLRERRWSLAASIARELAKDPANAGFAAGTTCLANAGAGRFTQAVDLANAELAVHPENTRALVARAQAARGLSRHADALADYDTVLRLEPDGHWVRLERAQTLEAMHEVPKAMTALDELVHLDRNMVDARFHRARLRLGQVNDEIQIARQEPSDQRRSKFESAKQMLDRVDEDLAEVTKQVQDPTGESPIGLLTQRSKELRQAVETALLLDRDR